MIAELSPLVLERQGATSSDSLRQHLAYADGLRALAILGVILFHVGALWTLAFHRSGSVPPILMLGSHGVELFFLLSSFCLAYPVLAILRDDKSVSFDIARFAAKRLTRILPSYYVAIAILLLVPFVAERLGHPIALGASNVTPIDIIKQIFFIDSNANFVNPSYWTLAIEARWCIVFPLALLLWIRSRRAFGIVTVLAMLSTFTRAASIDLGLLPAFLLGIVAADLRVQPLRSERFAAPLAVLFAVAAYFLGPYASLAIPYSAFGHDLIFRTNALWQLAVFFAVVAAGSVPLLERILGSRTLELLALASYGIFLVFEPVLAVSYRALRAPLGPSLAILVGTLAAVVAGAIFWFCVDRFFANPATRRRFADRIAPLFVRSLPLAGIPGAMEIWEVVPRRAVPEAIVLPTPPSLEPAIDGGAPQRTQRAALRVVETDDALAEGRRKAEEVRSLERDEAERRSADARPWGERSLAAWERLRSDEAARKERSRKDREEAERRAADARAHSEREQGERRATDERAAKEREESSRRAAEELANKARAAEEKRAADDLARQQREREEQRAVEELARKARADEEQRAAAAAVAAAAELERTQREDAERAAAAAELERKAREDAERAAAAAELERKQREDAERAAAAELERKAREEADRAAAEAAAAAELERTQREEAERAAAAAALELERTHREEAERAAAAATAAAELERKAREEAERAAGVAAAAAELERKQREEIERAAALAATAELERKQREEAERAASAAAAAAAAAAEHERKLRAEAERSAAEERERKEGEDAQRREAEERARAEAERRAAQEQVWKERSTAAWDRLKAEEQARKDRARRERENAERVAAEGRARKEREEAEQRAAEEQARKEREAAAAAAAPKPGPVAAPAADDAGARAAKERAWKERSAAAWERVRAEERERRTSAEAAPVAIAPAAEANAAPGDASAAPADAIAANAEEAERTRAAAESAAKERVAADWQTAQARAAALRSEVETRGGHEVFPRAWAHWWTDRFGKRIPEPDLPRESIADRIARDFGAIAVPDSEHVAMADVREQTPSVE